jgi:hypothetical protein
MRAARVVTWILVVAACLAVKAQTAGQQRVPVLVELFTSEGCSDCPPAERLLREVDSAQPFAGVHAIVLEEHVTYWDQQGWRDPFSLEQMTDRQTEYRYRFGLNDVYTPQMVVDGSEQFVGSNGPALAKAMAAEAPKPKDALTIDGAQFGDGVATFAVHGTIRKDVRVVAVVAADATVSHVSNGENAGKTLNHVAVVRALKEFNGEALDGRPLKVEAKGVSGPVRIVVFLVERKSAHVVGVAEETLNPKAQARG